jgi:dTDP-4-amino-4,6-dideoxygalactose transaminase
VIIPFYDLARISLRHQGACDEAYRRVFTSGRFILGREVEAFEVEFARYCETSYCVGVANGLEALHLILLAYGIGPGDEVIVPSNTFIATWLAVSHCGATPVPVEPLEGTFNIAASQISNAISPRTAAVIPVHLYGQTVDMDPIIELTARKGLVVIEDAAQAHGSRYRGRMACGLGDAAATSFYPGKNLGALGDGGAILTKDLAVAEKVRVLANYGSREKYRHELVGFNSRLDELQAAFLRIKLSHLESDNNARRKIASQYLVALAGLPLGLPDVPDWAIPVWHLFVIQAQERDTLRKYLAARGIETIIHYPIPPHKQGCYPSYAHLSLPIAEQMGRESLSLPISPIMSELEVNYVVECIRSFFGVH